MMLTVTVGHSRPYPRLHDHPPLIATTQRIRVRNRNAQGEAEREASGPQRATHGAGARCPCPNRLS